LLHMFEVIGVKAGLELRLHLTRVHSRSGPEPDPEPGPPLLLERFGVHHRRQEEIGDRAWLGARETLGSDADDLYRAAADSEGFADHRRVACKPALPV